MSVETVGMSVEFVRSFRKEVKLPAQLYHHRCQLKLFQLSVESVRWKLERGKCQHNLPVKDVSRNREMSVEFVRWIQKKWSCQHNYTTEDASWVCFNCQLKMSVESVRWKLERGKCQHNLPVKDVSWNWEISVGFVRWNSKLSEAASSIFPLQMTLRDVSWIVRLS